MGRTLKQDNMDFNIFSDLKSMLACYQAFGVENLPVDLEAFKSIISSRLSDRGLMLEELRKDIGECTRCKLSKQRKNIVFGEGSSSSKIMFIGEAPGKEEDIQSRPFVGEAGVLLTRLIEKMGLKRGEVYIANIVKCRPPENRNPEDDEISSCISFVDRQIEIIRPEVIITLGRIALQSLMKNPSLKITAVRGRFFDYKGIPVMPTFHPAYLLRNPGDKWKTWSDAQRAMEKIKTEVVK